MNADVKQITFTFWRASQRVLPVGDVTGRWNRLVWKCQRVHRGDDGQPGCSVNNCSCHIGHGKKKNLTTKNWNIKVLMAYKVCLIWGFIQVLMIIICSHISKIDARIYIVGHITPPGVFHYLLYILYLQNVEWYLTQSQSYASFRNQDVVQDKSGFKFWHADGWIEVAINSRKWLGSFQRGKCLWRHLMTSSKHEL